VKQGNSNNTSQRPRTDLNKNEGTPILKSLQQLKDYRSKNSSKNCQKIVKKSSKKQIRQNICQKIVEIRQKIKKFIKNFVKIFVKKFVKTFFRKFIKKFVKKFVKYMTYHRYTRNLKKPQGHQSNEFYVILCIRTIYDTISVLRSSAHPASGRRA
jgi:hypothetical protein